MTLDCLYHRKQGAAPEVTVKSWSVYEVPIWAGGHTGEDPEETCCNSGKCWYRTVPVCEQSHLSRNPGASDGDRSTALLQTIYSTTFLTLATAVKASVRFHHAKVSFSLMSSTITIKHQSKF